MENSIGVQHIEDFWGVALSSQKKTLEWEGEDDDDTTPSDIDVEKTLELRQACLGASAKLNERNVVQITTENDEGEFVTHTILSMKVGGTEQCPLFLTLHPPVKFELVSGSGPVHIVGSVNEAMTPWMSSSDEDDSDEDNEITSPEVKSLISSASKKRPATSPAKKAAKVAKLDTLEDEMDTSTEKVKAVKKLKPTEEDDDDDDDDDSEEQEESDEEEEEDTSDDDDEEEEESVPVPKANGKPKAKPEKLASKSGKKSVEFKTPQPKKPVVKFAPKAIHSAPTTPKQKGDKKKSAMKQKWQGKKKN